MQKIKSSEANTTCVDCALYGVQWETSQRLKKSDTVGACTLHYDNALFMQPTLVFYSFLFLRIHRSRTP